MKARCLSTVFLLLLLGGPPSAVAESCPAKVCGEPGDLGIFGDAAGTQYSLEVSGFVPFNIYVVLFGPPGGIRSYDFGISPMPDFIVLDITIQNGGVSLSDPAEGDYVVEFPTCLEWWPRIGLARINMGYFAGPTAPADYAICLGLSDAPVMPNRISFANCHDERIQFGLAANGMDIYPDGCLILNATMGFDPCPTESGNFGALKARFGRP